MPPPNDDKLKKLHQNLIKEGYDLPDYETFGKDMADSIKRDKFYNNLVKEGYDLPDFKTFTTDMGYGEKKKEAENTVSISLGGLLPVQSQQNSTLSESNNISDNNQTNVSMDGVSQPIPSEEKIKNLHPDYYQEIQKAKKIASENPAIAQDINNSISDANKFSDMVIGKLSEDGTQYIDANGNPLKQFKEGDIVSVPKDMKLNDGHKHETGFVQYIKNNDGSFSWRSVTPPDPSFSMAKENQPQDVTVIGSKELKIPEFQRKIEDITGVKLMQPFTSPEDWQKDVDKLPPSLQEFSLYNKDNDKGTAIPKFLNNHPEIATELNYELQRAPSSLETNYGRYNATVKAINTAYSLNAPIESAFKTNDPNQLVDAPAFYKNFEAINKGHEEVRKLQDRIDLLGNNPKYKDQVSKLLLQQKSIMDGLKPNMEFMQDPKNSLVLQNMDNNEQLAQKQKKGFDLIRGIKNFFPQMRADEFKAAEEEQKAHDNPLNYLNNPLTAAYREAKKALIDFGGWIVEKGMQNPIPSSIDPMAKKRRELASAIDELINRENANNLTPNTGNVASDFLTHTAGTVGSLVTAFGGGAGVGKRVANAITFGVGAMQNAGREASAEGMTEKDASQYKTVNGMLMGLLGYGLGGGNILKKEFTPSADLISRLLNKDTQELAAKELSNEIVKNGLIEGVKETGKAGLKMGLEMKAISIANAINNQILNAKGGYTLPETITDFSADMANVLTGSLLHLGTAAITSKGRSVAEQEAAQKAMVYRAAQGHTKEVLESLDAAEKMPNADKQAISKIRDAVIETESKNFPSDATPEQIAQALSFATKISEIDKKLETTDKEFTTKLNSDKKEAQEKIDEIMANPEKAKKDVAKEINRIEDEFKKVAQPIGEIGRNETTDLTGKTIENASKDIQEPISETIGEVKENVPVPTEEKGVVKEGIDKEGRVTEEKPLIINKDNKIDYTTKSGRQIVKYENGVLKVVDTKTGGSVAKNTYKKAIQEYADSFDFTIGEKSTEIPKGVKTEDEAKSHIIETSNNPYELAEVYVNEEPTTQPLSTVERMIADYGIGKTTNDSFNRFGDRNKKGLSLAKSYLDNGKGNSIDSIAKEMSDHYGKEITPEDLIDFMIRFPNGEREALKEVENQFAIDAASKFQDLTGISLNKEIAEKAINQQFNKLSKERQAIAQQDYETAKQYEDDYWKAFDETNGFTKESASRKTISAGEESGEQPQIKDGRSKKEQIVDIFDRMEEAQRSKKTNKGKSEVMYEVAKENGEVGEKAFFVQDNFREIVNRMKILKDETGNSILKIEC